MSETVAVIVASFGDKEKWDRIAEPAIKSVNLQSRQPDEFFRIHGTDLHEARNSGALTAKSKYLLFLDCDDQFEPGYIEAMMRPGIYPNELRYPRIRYISENIVNPKYEPEPMVFPRKALDRGNFMVIGTLVEREIFLAVGGFRELKAYEDWDLWIRCWLYGGEPRLIKDAIYRVTKRPNSRNSLKDARAGMELCREIIAYNKQWQKDMRKEGKLQ